MKKLFAALAICVSTVAFAQADTNQNPPAPAEKQEKKGLNKLDTGVEATDLRTQKPGDSAQEATGGSGSEKTNEKTVTEKAKDVLGMDDKDKSAQKTQDDAIFKKTAQAFNLNGTLKSVSGQELTLERQQGLPEVVLDVEEQTVVMLDGKPSQVDQLPEGAKVRAKFNLKGDDTIAVRIDAKSAGMKKSTPAAGGSGAAGQKMKDAGQDAKAGMKEAGQDMKDASKDTRNNMDPQMNQ